MKGKAGQEKMSVVDVDWFFTLENLEKFSDEELECILRELQVYSSFIVASPGSPLPPPLTAALTATVTGLVGETCL